MKILITLTITSIAIAARLDSNYIPPNVRANTINTVLQTPFGPDDPMDQKYPSQDQNYAIQDQNYPNQDQNYATQAQEFGTRSKNYASQVQILRYENEIDDKGWHYSYETSDGTMAQQDGRALPGPTPEEGSLAVSGSYSFVADDGQTYAITYTADETGYHPSGDHLPTPPPIPEEILKSLQLTASDDGKLDGQYGSQKSSYDADAGY